VFVAAQFGDAVAVIDVATGGVVDSVPVGVRPIAAGRFIVDRASLFADGFEQGDPGAWSANVP
jgi:YVTN family beta-propeller protein